MKTRLPSNLWSFAAAATLLLVAPLCILLYTNLLDWTRTEVRLANTRAAVSAAENLYSTTLAAESGVRTYLATGHAVSLADLEKDTAAMLRDISFLRQFSGKRPAYCGNVNRLGELTGERLAAFRTSIQARRSGPLQAGRLSALTRRGDALTLRLRDEVHAMLGTLRSNQGLMRLELNAGRVQSGRLLAVIFSVLFIFLLTVFYALLRGEGRRRRAELELADLNARLQSVLDSATQLSMIATDLSGKITLFNSGAEKMLGYSTAEMVGKATPERVHLKEEVEARARELSASLGREVSGFDVFVELARAGGHERREWTYVRRDGTKVPVELVVTAIKDHSGLLTGFLGLATDISSRKRSQLQMRKLSTAVKSSPTSIVITGRNGAIEYVNPKFLELTGYAENELIGQNPRLIASGRTPKSLYKELWDTLLSGRNWHGELLNRKKNGELFWEYADISPVKDPAGNITNFVAVKLDITDRRLAQREMEKARDAAVELARLKSEFLANMSHEIRTPMNAIIGMTGLLLGTELSPRQREYAATISSAGESLLDIINDILDFSKIESGKLQMETIDFGLRETVESALDLLAQRAQDKGLELASFIEEAVPDALRGDPGRVRQILVNLVGNAIKFTEKGEILATVSAAGTTADGVTLRFSVKDTGIGIAPGAGRDLFQAFTQADTSTTRKYGGTGLGLSICKKLTELMGGEIGFSSEPGKGSEFWFRLPFGRTAGQAESAPRNALEGLRVLVVDDNEASRRIVGHYLGTWKMDASAEASGEAALAVLRGAAADGRPFRLAVVDMQMPGMDGAMLARKIKEGLPAGSPGVVLLTPLGLDLSRKELDADGIAVCIHKPMRPALLRSALEAALKAPPGAERGTEPPKDGPARKYFRVLVAEDNTVNQKVALNQLERLGYEADVAANGLEAVEAVRTRPYDLVLMDCQMPEMDGFQAAAEIRRLQADDQRRTPIVAMTANALKGDQEKCLAAGMDDYIPKPVRIEKLAETLKRWDAPLDPFTIKDLEEVGGRNAPEFLSDLAEAYLRDLRARLEAITSAAAAGDAEALRKAAHSLKGSSANLGARRIQKLCDMLEQGGASGDLRRAGELLAALAAAARETAPALAALIQG